MCVMKPQRCRGNLHETSRSSYGEGKSPFKIVVARLTARPYHVMQLKDVTQENEIPGGDSEVIIL